MMSTLIVKSINKNHNIKLEECIAYLEVDKADSILVEYEVIKQGDFSLQIDYCNSWKAIFRINILLGQNPLRLKSFLTKIESNIYELTQNNIKNFIGGNYSNILTLHLSNSFDFENIFFLDEGNSALTFHSLRETNSIHFSSKNHVKNQIKFILYGFIGIRYYHIKKRVSFFSIYYTLPNTAKTTIIPNNYKVLKLKLSNQKVVDKQVFIIGTPFVEKGFISSIDYIKILHKIKERFLGHELSYFPHKGESMENVLEIESGLGFNIIHSSLHIEDYLLKEKAVPQIIVTTISSALDNLINIYGGKMLFFSLKVDTSTFLKSKNHFDSLYKYYDQYKTRSDFYYIKDNTI